MDIFDYFNISFIFLYGISIGSFLNVVIYRLPLNIPISKGRSFCTSCKNSLSAKDLIPVFSYAFQKGKCRYCGEKISFRYPFVELLTAIGFVLCYLQFGLNLYMVLCSLLMCVLICAAFIDLDHTIVPDRFHVIIIIIGIFLYILHPVPSLANRIIGGLVVSGVMLVVSYFTGGIGGGDIKLMAVCGLILGLQLNVFAFFLAYIIGSICLIPSIINKKVNRQTEIPMVPYFAVSIIFSLLYGNQIINWYLSLF